MKRILLVLLALAAMIAGCGGGEQATAEPTPQPTAQPTATAAPLPTSTPSAADEGILDQFRQQVILAVTAKDSGTMASLMTDPHWIGRWRSEPSMMPPADAANELVANQMPPDSAPTFTAPPAPLPDMLEGMTPQNLVGPDVEVVDAVFSTGWGVDGSGEALLILTFDAEDGYRWYGTLIAQGGFLPDEGSGVSGTPVGTEGESTLEGIQEVVRTAIASRDATLMANTMTDPFTIGFWQSEGISMPPFDAANELLLYYLAPGAAVQFPDLPADFTTRTGIDPETLFGPDANVAGVMYSTGWGMDSAGEALLIFTQTPDRVYAWSHILIAAQGFD